jgi:hypothetical protein
MDTLRQQQIRELAEQMKHASDPETHMLAVGALELLEFVDELAVALQITTERCCEATQRAYEEELYQRLADCQGNACI